MTKHQSTKHQSLKKRTGGRGVALKKKYIYIYKGATISHFPYNVEPENVRPNYIEMPGWEQDLTKMSEVSQLPENLMNYINYLEEVLEVPIKIVSVGPDRTQTIHR